MAPGVAVAGGELLPLRPHPVRPRRSGLLCGRPRRPGPSGAQPGQENRSSPGQAGSPRPRRTQALAALCDQLTAAGTRYPGTGLVLRCEVKSRPGPA